MVGGEEEEEEEEEEEDEEEEKEDLVFVSQLVGLRGSGGDKRKRGDVVEEGQKKK